MKPLALLLMCLFVAARIVFESLNALLDWIFYPLPSRWVVMTISSDESTNKVISISGRK